MTIKITKENINTINLAAIDSQHKKLENIASKKGFEYYTHQISNAIEVFLDWVRRIITWPEADFFWSDRKIRQFFDDEVRVLSSSTVQPNERFLQIVHKVKQTAAKCSQLRSIAGLQESINQLENIEKTTRLALENLKQPEFVPPEPDLPSPPKDEPSRRLTLPPQTAHTISSIALPTIQPLPAGSSPQEKPTNTPMPLQTHQVVVAKDKVGNFSIRKLLGIGLIVFAVLWGANKLRNSQESLFKMRVVNNLGDSIPKTQPVNLIAPPNSIATEKPPSNFDREFISPAPGSNAEKQPEYNIPTPPTPAPSIVPSFAPSKANPDMSPPISPFPPRATTSVSSGTPVPASPKIPEASLPPREPAANPWTFGLPGFRGITALAAAAAASVAGYFFTKEEVRGSRGSKDLQKALISYSPLCFPGMNLRNLESYSKSEEWIAHARTAKIYYNPQQLSKNDALRIIDQREPTNIAMIQSYNKKKLKETYGYQESVYNNPSARKEDGSSFKDLPNTASVYSETFLWKPPGGNKRIHIACLSLPAPALDTNKQPHFNYYVSNGVLDAKKYEHEMHFLFKTVEISVRDNLLSAFNGKGIKRVVLSQFGQEAFLKGLKGKDRQKARDIFRNQLELFLRRTKDIQDKGVKVVMSEYILSENSEILQKLLDLIVGDIIDTAEEGDYILNAWDPHSAAGNGNDCDASFDGAMGKASGILLTQSTWINPHLKSEKALVPVMQDDEDVEPGKIEVFSSEIKGDPDEH